MRWNHLWTRTVLLAAMFSLAVGGSFAAPADVAVADDAVSLVSQTDDPDMAPKKSRKKNDKGDKGKSDKDKDKEKPFDEVVEDMDRIEGLFNFYRNEKEGKVYLEILPDQLDKDFIYSAKFERGTGERGLYGTIMMDEFVFQWHRMGKQIQWVQQNLRFRADEGSPAERAVANSFSDSVMLSAKILSEPHPDRDSVLIDLSKVFLTGDLHGVAGYLKRVYQGGYKQDKENSGFVMVKSFPLNSEIGTVARFVAGSTKRGSVTIPDSRSMNLRFRYSLVALPDNDYMPRLADDRVGYFMDMFLDYSADKTDTLYVRYINRFKLKKKDPGAEISEPEEPIVFWLENSIPLEYRDFFREGVLMWNTAFEKAGFKNAIEVRQQPDEADWDPADIRYNTIRWFVGYDASFAIGPSHTNPYTGQIIDADIGFSEGLVRLGARRRYELYVSPVARMQTMMEEPEPLPWQTDPSRLCTYANEMVEMMSLGYDLLSSRGTWSSEEEKEFVRQYIAEVTAHEVGHTLGLRHNFRASTINRMDQLADESRTHRVGLAASVMDYNPAIIAIKGEKQGDYLPTVVGSYDDWVIEYGYTQISGVASQEDEADELARIASRGADPLHPYATDEDAGLSARAMDPRNNRFDFATDPLEFYRHEIKLVGELWANMEDKLLEDGESYAILRRAMGYSWTPYFRGSLVAAKHIGGIYHNRDHAGDPNGRLPYVPVPAERQREALKFLSEEIWDPEVFVAPAKVLQKLQFERFWDFEFSNFTTPRLDYPLHNIATFVQTTVLGSLYHPLRLARMQDSALMFDNPADAFTMADLFVGIRSSLWSELDSGSNINTFRRDLQRAHADRLIRMTLRASAAMPADASSLARADLVHLKGQIENALAGSLDHSTKAHLQETHARIGQALDAPMVRS